MKVPDRNASGNSYIRLVAPVALGPGTHSLTYDLTYDMAQVNNRSSVQVRMVPGTLPSTF